MRTNLLQGRQAAIVLRRVTSSAMRHRCKRMLNKVADRKLRLAGACLLPPAFAYHSAKLAAALESITTATCAKWEKQAHAGAAGPTYEKQRAAPRDDVAAAAWYRRAAEQNYALAQFNRAQMYAEGPLGHSVETLTPSGKETIVP